ncbi:cyanate permease [Stackebrandtia endophytica]|uniref:Cyanate permease n=1 Tax=Stackebrandtia endophytica TaxID=1496996 RepID=A0A543AV82_9ACTN|nr:MFS transporter [Stackebrandtia endophytica]TQL76489.1 cyanate permease [Stackebrandtia endophytica]
MTTPQRAATAALTTTVATVCPVFLVGGLSVQIMDELTFSPAGLGLAVALYFTTSALVSVWSGRFVERVGVRKAAVAAIVLVAIALVGIAASVTFTMLIVMLILAGPANSLGQLSANALLAKRIPPKRQGLMFGIKQAAIPASTTLAGLSVPLIALTLGWRWAFGFAALLALGALLLLPPNPGAAAKAAPHPAARRRPSAALVVITAAAALGATAANPLGTFIADYAVFRGMSEAFAGMTVTIGGLAGVVARISVGWLADKRSSGRLSMIAIMLAAGSMGLLILLAPGLWTIPVGTAVGFALGWAWPGLLNFAITLRHPDAPAAATGVTQTGVYLGGGIGPLSFGAIVDLWGYPTAWTTMSVLMLVGAALMVVGRRMLLRVT